METRRVRWARAKKLVNEPLAYFIKSGRLCTEWAFDCTVPHCTAFNDLRLTPSGIWCREHYLNTPSCVLCDEPVVLDSGWWPGNMYCRNHFWKEGEEIDDEIYSDVAGSKSKA